MYTTLHLHSSIFVNLLVNLSAVLKREDESWNSREKVDGFLDATFWNFGAFASAF